MDHAEDHLQYELKRLMPELIDRRRRHSLEAFTVCQKLLGQTASAANSDDLSGLWRTLAAALRQLQDRRLLPADMQRHAQQWFVIAKDAEKALQEGQYELVQRYIDALSPSHAATVEQLFAAAQARFAASHSAAVVQSPVTTAIEVAEMEEGAVEQTVAATPTVVQPAVTIAGGVAEVEGAEHTCPEEGAKAPAPASQVSREYLRALGIPTRRINTWIREGVLLGGEPNIFERTSEVHRLITEFLNRC